MNAPNTTLWPLLFTYRGTIMGQGFLASVSFCGRLLATVEPEGVWLDGVNPGALAVGGPSMEAANVELRETITRVLGGYASASSTFEAFRGAVERYYHETDEYSTTTWDTALEELKAGRLGQIEGLQRKPVDWSCHVSVEPQRIEDVTPRVADSLLLKAA